MQRQTVPWRAGDLVLLSSIATVAMAVIVGAWVGSSGTTTLTTEEGWLAVAIVAAVAAGVGNGLWLLAGHRALRVRQRELAGRARILFPSADATPVAPAGRSDQPEVGPATDRLTAADGAERPPALVASARMTHFHLSDCPLVADKEVRARSLGAHRRAGRKPCAVCRPAEQAHEMEELRG